MISATAGVHHPKLPMSDLDRSVHCASRPGCRVVIESNSRSHRGGVSMTHRDGRPWLRLTLDSARAVAAAGFDYTSIGAPDRAALEALDAHLPELGEAHADVQFATKGWILPTRCCTAPDGHEVRFHPMESHTQTDPTPPLLVDDAIASAQAREKQWLASRVTSRDAEDGTR